MNTPGDALHELEKPITNKPARDLPIKPITIKEIEDEMKKRVSFIDKEFTNGFEFIKNQPKSVSFFGSSRLTSDNPYYKIAEDLAARIALLGYSVLSGGGPGIMEAANKGAKEVGGVSLGLTISLPHEQSRNKYLTDYRDFYYFFIRKVMLSFSAEAYIFFPGGFGTLDEFFETITLVQTHKIENVPIYLVGSDFWKPLEHFMRVQMFEKNAAIDESDLSLYTITDDLALIVEGVTAAPVRNGMRLPDGYGEQPIS